MLSSSVNLSSNEILNIMTISPRVTSVMAENATHVKARLVVPRVVSIRTYSLESTEAANPTAPACVHVADTSKKMLDKKLSEPATCETAREGNGLTSRSEPLPLISSCHPGKVERRRTTMSADAAEIILKR